MQGEIYSREQLEKNKHWRATFRHVIARGSPRDIVVCLMKAYPKGYIWKRPNTAHAEAFDPETLQEMVNAGRYQLISGKLPRGVKKPKPPKKEKKHKEGDRVAV